ncbi:MAG: hypothetical protein ACPG5T_01705 [Endozoicomonas sp.]
MSKVGKIVTYNTTKEQMEAMKTLGCNPQEQLPATVVAEHDPEDKKSLVNLKVHIDGPLPDMWVTSVPHGKEVNNWH